MAKTVDTLIGLQWGSEGKGKIAAYLSEEYNGMVRSGGSQAGHTFYHNKQKYIHRQIPCGVINPNCLLYISAGGLVNLEVLGEEIRTHQIYPDRLMIDNHAMVITKEHIEMERKSSLKKRIASTIEGVGAAQAEKIWRRATLFDHYAYEDPELYFFSNDTAQAINEQIERGHPILLEGTQGFGLSLDHGTYPYCTSRNVTSSALLADAGISPESHKQTIGVMRAYPIRVGGHSGPTGSKELTWHEITKRSGSPKPIEEYTSVTKRLRRVFEQDYEILKRAITINKPNQIALMFLDYINAEDFGKTNFEELSAKSKNYILKLEYILKVPITLIGTGPDEKHIIDRRTKIQRRKSLDINVLEDLGSDLWPVNFYNHDWGSGYLENFINRKLTAPDGNSLERNIFLS